MAPSPDSTAATAGPSQRQSCDRCHKQKLRCGRSKSSNSGVCDRCLAKRVQCVYSFSLPKGRPSLHRLAEKPSVSSTSPVAGSSPKTGPVVLEPEPPKTPVMASEPNIAGAKMDDDSVNIANTLNTGEPSVIPGLTETAMFPWVETLMWDETQPEIDWISSDMRHGDGFSASLDPRAPVMALDLAGQHGVKNNGVQMVQMDVSPASQKSSPSLAITQLSQLSMSLSSLRSVSYLLAKIAESPSGRQLPLTNPASFDSVAAWLSHCEIYERYPAGVSGNATADIADPMCPSPDIKAQTGSIGALRDVFSASHRLLEILRHLKAGNVPEESSHQEAAEEGQQGHSAVSIIRHLVLACDALLLEIYSAIVMALQHDAGLGESTNPGSSTILGDVRLVLVAQLCSYMVQRQHQAVDQYLGPANTQNVEGDALGELRLQVQQRLVQLHQMLRSIA
ncbi:hypothetical protein BKA56DRAFT_96291 [Ilyonectria sp. MPI-CAGE-AT-0026]|nr:hypothetical protein BKA56DRAFT_96291 [Ilyonectria sp. MPI-CAGE-AT-0026]